MQDWEIYVGQFFTKTAADLWGECVRRIPSNYANRLLFLDDNTAGDRWRPTILTTITIKAHSITRHALRYAVVNGQTGDTDGETPLAAINRVLQQRFVNPAVVHRPAAASPPAAM